MEQLTCIVAIYNIENYLEKCLDSISKQTYKNFTCLLVNDGSTDSSGQIANNYATKDSRFILLDKQNGGLSDARNHGLKFCKSEYVCFVDGDDTLEIDAFETLMSYDSDIVIGAYNQLYLQNNYKEFMPLNLTQGTYNLENKKEILAYCPNCAWAKLYKTSLFKDNNIYYPKGYRQEDLGTTAKLLLKSNTITIINKAIINYLIDRPNNITSLIDEKIYHVIDMINLIKNFYVSNDKYENFKYELKYLARINYMQALKKSINLKDRDFTFKFIDEIFKSLDLFKCKDKYQYKYHKYDFIYSNKLLLKLYYLYKNRNSN